MQGPSNVSQDKMPEELRNRIYDIGTKRVLNYAKENGYDGVAWTTGDMQAQRYDLSKHVDNIDVNPKGGNREVSIYFKNDTDGYLQLDVDASGIVTATANKRGEPFVGKPIQEVVGKEVGGKIIQTVKRENLSGLDLQVGGEGLKSLYDKTLPSMFKKYGKEPVRTIDIGKVYDELMRPYYYEGPDFTAHELTSKLQNANIFDTPYSTASNIRMIIKHMNDTGESFKNAADKFISLS